MKRRNRNVRWILCSVAALMLAVAPFASAQAHPANSGVAQAPSESDVADTQSQLLKLLRLSPILTTVVARDPSLLADQAYVERSNPELAQFLTAHPEIAKNPEFYLFSNLVQGRGRREQVLERAVWPDLAPDERRPSQISDVMHQIIPIIIVPAIFLAIVWSIKIFVDGRRWNRTFKLQSEVHSRLIDRFTSSQDLAAYMQTEAGSRFLEASPMALGSNAGMQMPNVVARILTPLTVGTIMVLSGIGLFLLELHADADMVTPLLVLGTLALMPGIGFMLSAGATWIVAKRLGMLPEKEEFAGATTTQMNPHDRP